LDAPIGQLWELASANEFFVPPVESTATNQVPHSKGIRPGAGTHGNHAGK
jgi:hypothetical protein